MLSRETVSFVFQRVLNVSRDQVEENIRTLGKMKLTSFLRDQLDEVGCYILYRLSLKQ